MMRKAAALTEENGMVTAAVDIYMSVRQADRDDLETLLDLNRLLGTVDRYSELLFVKKRLLELTEDSEERVALRLEIAEIAGALEGGQDRISTLRANLEESPGHEETIEKIDRIM